jgi:DUF1680 family protein
MPVDPPVRASSRRHVLLGLAASPVALMASRAFADTFDLPTPPKFAAIAPAPLRPVAPRAALFPLGQVKLLDGPFLDARNWNIGYMKRLDTDRLLHTFRLNAGLASLATPLGGWEAPDCELRGHFSGHYMSGCAIAYAATGDEDMRARGLRMVASLAQCQQKLNLGGYLSAFPVSLFDRLAAGQPVWAPFYTYHKIMAGLLDMHELAGSDQALKVALGMAAWTDAWTAARDADAMQKVMENEFGGMNDALYRLAAISSDAHWIEVGDRFTKRRVFEPLANRRDELRGLHMNTHVPQVIGASRRYALTGDPRYHAVSTFFWETVTEARTYATGGSSNNEHWLTDAGLLGTEAAQGDHHQECCCAYNMMKLGRQHYLYDPQVAYVDYIERNLLNHRLGMIQPQTGLTGYFLSMTPGAWKTHGTDETTFWCCNGTALEDFSQLASAAYAHDSNGLYVNLFIASELDWPERGVRLRQETRFPDTPRTRLAFDKADGRPMTVRLRIPGWADDRVQVRINGQVSEMSAASGSYLLLHRAWRSGDVIELDMPMPMRLEAYADRPQEAALVVGPVVLAQQLPMDDLPQSLLTEQGPNLAKASPVTPAILPADIADRLRPSGEGGLHFTAQTEQGAIAFKPISESWARFAVYNRIKI